VSRRSPDPYSDWVVRVWNSCRIALDQQGSMNQTEFEIIEKVRDLIVELEPYAPQCRKCSVIVNQGRNLTESTHA